MSSIQGTLIDGPTRDSVTVVHLRERDARGHHDVLHHGRMLNSRVRILVKRLDQDAPTPARQARPHKRLRVFNGEYSSLDGNASG